MKKKITVMVLAVMILGATGFAFADGSFGPASIYADLTGTTEAEAYAAKVESGGTFGELAKEEGVYDDFQKRALEAKEQKIAAMVSAQDLTQEEADVILEKLENCDGKSTGVLRNSLGLRQGAENGQRKGLCDGSGQGQNVGQGQGEGKMQRRGNSL